MSISFSIVTATYNSAATVADCVASVRTQLYKAEHIIVDGASHDNTLDVIRTLSPSCTIISEPDNGIYDAMNKGIALAKGDVIGILNSDDFYVDNQVLSKVAKVFACLDVDAVYADIVFVKPDNLNKIVRYYSGADFKLSNFSQGLMPPHPTFFVRKECYIRYGLYRKDYQIAADFELLLRFMVTYNIRCQYLPDILVKMRTGGASTRSLRSNITLNKEILKACSESGVSTNIFKVYSKYIRKCLQLLARPHIS